MADSKDPRGLTPLEGEPDPDGADCVGCGRCCHHPPETVHLLDHDENRMGEEVLRHLTVLQDRPPFMRFMKNAGSRCGALDVSVPGQYPCAIYSVRGDDCRVVEPGSPACLEARALGHLGGSLGYINTTRSRRDDDSQVG